MQGVSQVQMRVEPQGIDLEQTHLKRNERFLPPLFPRKENGVLSSGHTGVPCSSKDTSAFCAIPAKMDAEKHQKNGMNRSLSFVFEIRPHLFHGSLDNEPLPT